VLVLVTGAVLATGVATLWRLSRFARPVIPANLPVRHVVMVSFDTTRADHFGCYGNSWIRTPRVDALAGESILLTDYMTVASTTLPAHVSLMTGLYPHSHGVPRNGFVLHRDNVMLAEVLRDAGFHTAAFLGSFALDARFNFDQGFEHFDADFDVLVGPGRVDQNQRRAAAVSDAVRAYLDRAGVPEHLFLFVHYFDPHMPYDPPPPYDRLYGPHAGGIPIAQHPALASGAWTENARRHLRDYAGEVSYLDHQFGRLLDDLAQRGILEQALLVVTSDHGETMRAEAEHQFDHGWYATQEELRAVGIIRLPHGQPGGMRLDLPVASIDIVPTILGFLGLPAPARRDGTAIDLHTLSGIAASRTRFGEACKPWHAEQDGIWYNNRKARCVREGPHKYILTPYLSAEELFDLSRDPDERTNLLALRNADARARAAALRRKLEDWTATQRPRSTHFDRQRYLDTVHKLQALGYLEDWDVNEEDLAPEPEEP
jgi:arylsulfatase A-like enzyme